jgi:hypothetical protein
LGEHALVITYRLNGLGKGSTYFELEKTKNGPFGKYDEDFGATFDGNAIHSVGIDFDDEKLLRSSFKEFKQWVDATIGNSNG